MHCSPYYTLFLPHVPEGVAVFSKNYWHYKWLFLKSSHHCSAKQYVSDLYLIQVPY